MPHVLGSKYLRVFTPVTKNGIQVKHGKDGKVMYSIQELPLTARKYLERENNKLDEDHRHSFEEIDENQIKDPASLVKGAGVQALSAEQQLAVIKEQMAQLLRDNPDLAADLVNQTSSETTPKAEEVKLTPQQKANLTKEKNKQAATELV